MILYHDAYGRPASVMAIAIFDSKSHGLKSAIDSYMGRPIGVPCTFARSGLISLVARPNLRA